MLFGALILRPSEPIVQVPLGGNGCRGIDTVSAADLPTLAAEAVAGRYVLIGRQNDTQTDVFPSPVDGITPGVFWHAAMLENLLSRGSATLHDPLRWWRRIDPAKLLEILAIALVALPTRSLDRHVEHALSIREGADGGHLVVSLLVLAGIVLVPMGLAAIACLSWNWTPINWVGIVGAGLGVRVAVMSGVYARFTGAPRSEPRPLPEHDFSNAQLAAAMLAVFLVVALWSGIVAD